MHHLWAVSEGIPYRSSHILHYLIIQCVYTGKYVLILAEQGSYLEIMPLPICLTGGRKKQVWVYAS